MMDEIEVFVGEDGDCEAVYSDRLAEVFAGEETETRRVSHVEPASTIGWDADGWIADMRPVRGPVLHDGFEPDLPSNVKRPFATRQAALEAEVAWLRARMAEGPLPR